MSETSEAVRLAVRIANDPTHGYDQLRRWGPDYDCSSFIIDLWEQIGVKLKSAGATYTGNMRRAALSVGFQDVTKEVTLENGRGLQLGDILLNEQKHAAMFVGNGQLVHASINEKGTVSGGQTGDQTGREICVRGYFNYPWNCVLRYQEGADREGAPAQGTAPANTAEDLPVVRRGEISLTVLAIQAVLIARGYDCGPDGSDGKFGTNTEAALRRFQLENGLTVDGVCGPETWGCLLGVSK